MDSSACYQGKVKVDMTHASATNLSPGPGYNPSHRSVLQQGQSAVSVVPQLTPRASWGGHARLLAARVALQRRSASAARAPVAARNAAGSPVPNSPILCFDHPGAPFELTAHHRHVEALQLRLHAVRQSTLPRGTCTATVWPSRRAVATGVHAPFSFYIMLPSMISGLRVLSVSPGKALIN